jgi:hypothetical protein
MTTGIPAMTTTELLEYDRAIGRNLNGLPATEWDHATLVDVRHLLAERKAVRNALNARHVAVNN